MNWFMTAIRVAGVNFPVASSLIQLQAELDSNSIHKRIDKLEDPISHLHPDVQELSKQLYNMLKHCKSDEIKPDKAFCSKYKRPIGILESINALTCLRCLTSIDPYSIQLTDPSYVLYLCKLCEDDSKMQKMITILEECKSGHWINAKATAMEFELPLVVVVSCMEVYKQRGYGIISKEIGNPAYCGN